MKRWAWLLVLAGCGGGGGHAARAPALPPRVARDGAASGPAIGAAVPLAAATKLRFELASASALDVNVIMTAENLATGTFVLPWSGTSAVREAKVLGDKARALPADSANWTIPECTSACRVTYRVDAGAFRRKRMFDEGSGTPTAVVTTVRMMLAEPQEYAGMVDVAWADEKRFTSGLTSLVGGASGPGTGSARFDFEAWDESTFVAVGDASCHSWRPSARYCLVGKLRMSDETFGAALARAEGGVSNFYGRVAAPALSVFAVSTPRARDIVFGKVRAMAGASVSYFVGERFENAKNDWVMVHELLHLGFPTLFDARWFSEGIATVYEPLVRYRLGDLDEATVWQGFAKNLPRGLPALTHAGAMLESADIDAMYWGSSTLLFEWEHALRAATAQKMGVEQALATLAQDYGKRAKDGVSMHLSTLDDTVRDLDRLTGTTTLSAIMAACQKDRKVTLHDLLGPFGVDDNGRIVDNSPPARARRERYVRGKP